MMGMILFGRIVFGRARKLTVGDIRRFFKYHPLDSQCISFNRIKPFDKRKSQVLFKNYFDSGDAIRMNTGTAVVVASVGLVFDLDAVRLYL